MYESVCVCERERDTHTETETERERETEGERMMYPAFTVALYQVESL